MWINVENVSLTVIDGFLLGDLLDRNYGTFLGTPCALAPLRKVFLCVIRNLSVFRSVLWFTPDSSNQKSFIAFLIEIFYILKSIIIYVLAFSFQD